VTAKIDRVARTLRVAPATDSSGLVVARGETGFRWRLPDNRPFGDASGAENKALRQRLNATRAASARKTATAPSGSIAISSEIALRGKLREISTSSSGAAPGSVGNSPLDAAATRLTRSAQANRGRHRGPVRQSDLRVRRKPALLRELDVLILAEAFRAGRSPRRDRNRAGWAVPVLRALAARVAFQPLPERLVFAPEASPKVGLSGSRQRNLFATSDNNPLLSVQAHPSVRATRSILAVTPWTSG